jgi:hypothetical protein
MLFVLCLWNLVCNSLHILHPFAHCDWFIYSVENAAGEVHLVGSKTFCILWQVSLVSALSDLTCVFVISK